MSNTLMKELVKRNVKKQQRQRVTLSAESDQVSWKFEICQQGKVLWRSTRKHIQPAGPRQYTHSNFNCFR